ncbi:MAG: hypothetical protein N2035_01825 [Chthoniobacterales bacterium]|nr:hypothetical protein [Chthoniobacterales bacterium]
MDQWSYAETQELRKTIDGLTTDNPHRKNVDNRMTSMIEYLEKFKKKVASNMRQIFSQKRDYELEEAIIRAQCATDPAQASLDTLQTELNRTQNEAYKISEAIFRTSNYSFGLQRFCERLFSIENRIYDTTMEAKAPLPVLIEQYALQPERPTSPKEKPSLLYRCFPIHRPPLHYLPHIRFPRPKNMHPEGIRRYNRRTRLQANPGSPSQRQRSRLHSA